jgi:hypothetical protein
MDKIRNTNKFVVIKLEGKAHLGDLSTVGWIILVGFKMVFREIVYVSMD